MDGKNDKSQDITKQLADTVSKSNKCIPKGLLLRELGFKQKEKKVSAEFQQAAEDKLVLKNHEELHCELPDVSRSTFLMVFSPDGTKVASTHGNHNVYVTDLNTGKNVNTLSGHPRTPWCIAFHPSSNQILASGCLGGQVRVWDLHGGSEIWTAESETVIASLAFHPTDRMLVIATYNELHFWDWSQPMPFTKCYTTNEKEKVRYVAFDPLGHKLITGISNAPHNQSQWDRVANTTSHQGATNPTASNTSQPQSNMMLPEHERRIATCYQSLVEQYERLVQRYHDLSRSRTAVTMDRGTDPMEMAESPSALPRPATSGANTPSSGLMGHLLLRGNGESSSSGSTSNVGSSNRSEDGAARDDAASTRGTGRGRFFRNISSIVLGHMIRRVQRQRATSSSRSSQIERVDQFPGSNIGSVALGGEVEAHEVANILPFENTPTTQASMGQQSFSPIAGSDGGEVTPDDSRPAASSTPVSESGGLPSDGSTEQPMTLGSIEIVSESGEVERHGLFSRLHSQVQPSTPSPPERPRRFFVSQRSAFQPRLPRADQQPQPESRPSRSPLLGSQRCSRFLLQRRLGGHSQRNHDNHPDSSPRDSMPSAPLDGSSEVGVRYGIQLLSRHIDNMQRLCRARLEILQLQQIRRMWEDLQRQIQSLHVAVIEGNFASIETPNIPTGRSRRGRFRLYSHPGDLSNSRMRCDARHYARRAADTSPGATEQGSHIPSVSQMLESARISDSSQPSSNERDTGSSGSSESAARNDQSSSSHAGVHEFGRAKPKPKYAERQKQPSQTDAEAASEDVSENMASSSRKHYTAKDVKSSQAPGSAEKATPETVDLNSPGPSNRKSSNDVSDQSTAAQKTEVDNMVPQKKPKVDGSKVKVADNSTSSTESSSDNKSSTVSNKMYGTTVSASDRGSANNTSHAHHSGNSSGESSENFTASAQACPPSTHFPHRLWRISRRVYLRRPRLLALGPRTRTMARHVSGSNMSPHRGYSLFRPFDFGRRPWFLQSVASQSSQLDQSNNAALQEDANNNNQRSNEEDNPRSCYIDAQAPSVQGSQVERNTSAGTSSQRGQTGSTEQRQHRGVRASQESTSQAGSSRARETDAGSNSATRGTKRKHDGTAKQTGSAPAQSNESSSQRTPQETSTSTSLRAMISRLSALVQQQREQQEIANSGLHHPSRRGNRRTNMWGLRETPGWLRSDGNSGSDSDSNPDNQRHRSWRRGSMEERDAPEREVSSRWSSPCQGHNQGEMDSEWVRESTRMRARQVLSMMVESLTQFFEANGLSNSTSHAVLDEQIYSLYVLLQLALELTDLLLAQLVTTRQQLEQQWVHRLHNPASLNTTETSEDNPTGGHGQGRRVRRLTRQDYEREFRRLDQIIGRTDNGCRVTPYRNRLFRFSRGVDEDYMARLDYLQGSSTSNAEQPGSGANVNRGEGSRRSGPRVSFYREEAFPMYARYPVLTRVVRGTNCRPLMRTVLSRAESRLRLPAYSRYPIRSPPGSPPDLFMRREERQSQSPPSDPSRGSHRPICSPPGPSAPPERRQQSEQQSPVSSQQQSQQDSFTVPLVRVNDVLIPDTSLLNQPSPRQRPQSPPPHPIPNIRNPFIQQQQQQGSTTMYATGSIGDPWRYSGIPGYPGIPVYPGDPSWRTGWRPRFLHPRYVGPNPFSDDQEEPLIGHQMETINVIRDSFIITDAPMSPNHRIQAWDFSKFMIPDISNAEKNIIVAECKIHNDASVDVSSDGRLLVTLLPTGRLSSSTAMLGIYSLEWESLGQCLYTTSFEQNAVSVSLSPANRHLLVGLASRRVALLPADRQTLAQVFRMEGGHPGRAVGARGRLCHIRDIEQSREQGYMSINCIRWAPGPGQGLVYGTNTGKLRVLR